MSEPASEDFQANAQELRADVEKALHVPGTSAEVDTNEGHRGVDVPRKARSLAVLCQCFLGIFCQGEPGSVVHVDAAAKTLGVERRRIYDILNVLHGFDMFKKHMKSQYEWLGLDGLAQRLEALRVEPPTVITSDENGKKERAMTRLTQRFAQLAMLSPVGAVELEDASIKLLGPSEEGEKSKSKVRRLYDIANVMCSLGLMEKTNIDKSKTWFKWLGTDEVAACIRSAAYSPAVMELAASNTNAAAAAFALPGVPAPFPPELQQLMQQQMMFQLPFAQMNEALLTMQPPTELTDASGVKHELSDVQGAAATGKDGDGDGQPSKRQKKDGESPSKQADLLPLAPLWPGAFPFPAMWPPGTAPPMIQEGQAVLDPAVLPGGIPLNAAQGTAALGLPGGLPVMMAQQANGSSGSANPIGGQAGVPGSEAGGAGTDMTSSLEYAMQMYAMYANISASLMLKPGEGANIPADVIPGMNLSAPMGLTMPQVGIDAVQSEAAPVTTEGQSLPPIEAVKGNAGGEPEGNQEPDGSGTHSQ